MTYSEKLSTEGLFTRKPFIERHCTEKPCSEGPCGGRYCTDRLALKISVLKVHRSGSTQIWEWAVLIVPVLDIPILKVPVLKVPVLKVSPLKVPLLKVQVLMVLVPKSCRFGIPTLQKKLDPKALYYKAPTKRHCSATLTLLVGLQWILIRKWGQTSLHWEGYVQHKNHYEIVHPSIFLTSTLNYTWHNKIAHRNPKLNKLKVFERAVFLQFASNMSGST